MALQWLKSIFNTSAPASNSQVSSDPAWAACPICKKPSDAKAVGNVPWTHQGPFHTAEFSLKHCLVCDVVYLDPMPTVQDLTTLYQGTAQFEGEHYEGDERVRLVLEYLTTCLIQRKLLPKSGEKMLEVGAGLSWMARACKSLDASIVTVAQDVTLEASDRCRWVDQYIVGAIEDLPDLGLFSLISLTHVIEHLTDPAAMLMLLSTKLAPGGKIFITAPYRPAGWKTSSGIQAWLDYSYLHVPAHTAYLSEAFFTKKAGLLGLALVSFDASHENGQAFEAILERVAV